MEEAKASGSKGFVRFIPHVVRVLMGIMFFLPGLNGFYKFIPDPKEPMSAGAQTLMAGFIASGYMMKFVLGTQLVVGLLLLINRFVPLALAVIMPVILHILLFHLFLAPSGNIIAIVILVMELYLAWCYRGVYRAMLQAKVSPGN